MPNQSPTGKEQPDAAKEYKLSRANLVELLTEYDGQVETAKNDTQEFRDRLTDANEHRHGQRGRPFPHLPFKGSADIRFPLIDKYIDRQKSIGFNSVIDAPHVARFLPSGDQKAFEYAGDLELYFDYLVSQWSSWFRDLEWLFDRWAEQGKCVVKVTWEQCYVPVTKTFTRQEAMRSLLEINQLHLNMQAQNRASQPEPLDRAKLKEAVAVMHDMSMDNPVHKTRIDAYFEQIDENEPVITLIVDRAENKGPVVRPVYTLHDLTVPVNTLRLAEADWIAHDCYYTERELRQQAEERGGKYKNVEAVIEACQKGKGDDTTESLDEAERARIGTNETGNEDLIRVRELFCWVPVKHIRRMKGKVYGGDDTPVRSVLTYCPDATDEGALRVMEYPYDHGGWPFEDADFEGGKRFYDCRGVSKMLQPFQEEYNISRNAAINRNTIMLSPPIVVHKSTGITGSMYRQVGQVLQTTIPPSQAIDVPRFPDLASGFNFDATAMEQFAAEYIGNPDLRMRGYDDSPTATQVQQVSASANASLRRRLELWHNFLGRVMTQVYELEKQYRFNSDEDEALQFPDVNSPEQGHTLTPAHFKPKYIIRSGGDLQRMDMMSANQLLFIAHQMASNPSKAAMYDEQAVEQTSLTKMIGPQMAKQWLRPRTEWKQREGQYMQMMAQAQATMNQKQQRTGKREQSRFKTIPNAQGGIVPQ